MLKVIEFIKNHKNWEHLLSLSPYCISIKKDKMYGMNLALLKYSQIDSDFHNDIVRECRGLIINLDTLEPISVPFFKFGNYGESYCPKIDWNSAKITQKLDGSLIKIVRIDDEFLISTNGSINAFSANIDTLNPCDYKNFGELIMNSSPIKEFTKEQWREYFQPGYTYMFELTSPYNRIVVKYDDIKLSFIGVRNNDTLQEELIYNHPLSKIFNTPKLYEFNSLDDCIKNANELPWDEEGYVVVDKNFNRVKVKSPKYVALHYLRGEGVLTYSKMLEMIMVNECDEFLNYFPEYTDMFTRTKNVYECLLKDMQKEWDDNENHINSLLSRKDKALYINTLKYKSWMYKKLDNPSMTLNEYIKMRLYIQMKTVVDGEVTYETIVSRSFFKNILDLIHNMQQDWIEQKENWIES